MYIIEGLVDSQWSWMHVSDSAVNASFANKDLANAAARDLVEVCGFEEDEIRVRPTRDFS